LRVAECYLLGISASSQIYCYCQNRPLMFHNSNLLIPFLFLVFSCKAQEIPQPNWEELSKTKPWEATEVYEPKVVRVTPGYLSLPPSDAIVLFDGNDMDQWRSGNFDYGVEMDQISVITQKMFDQDYASRKAASWKVQDGQMIVEPGTGSIETKGTYGSVQLHIEWLPPVNPEKEGQQYSNSGIFFMGLYEVQILNNYNNETYVNGQASSIYKQAHPLVNASRPPGEWQTYDIVFNAPEFNGQELVKRASITVFHNGVLTQNHFELQGPTCFIGKAHYTPHPEKLPLSLQDHGDKVRFRNVWIREL